jgi:thiamine-phosphate pyrophosphorylase
VSSFLPSTSLPLPRLLVVADSSATGGKPLVKVLKEVVAAGAQAVWLRDKHLGSDERRRLAAEVAELVHGADGVLLASPGPGAELADGLHLSAQDELPVAGQAQGGPMTGPTAARAEGPLHSASRCVPVGLGTGRPYRRVFCGRSCHSRPDLGRAAGEGCSWATLSPVFVSRSKPGYGPPLGTSALGHTPLPTWALGGVSAANARLCLEAGAAGVAVMGTLLGAGKPARAAEELLGVIERAPLGPRGKG